MIHVAAGDKRKSNCFAAEDLKANVKQQRRWTSRTSAADDTTTIALMDIPQQKTHVTTQVFGVESCKRRPPHGQQPEIRCNVLSPATGYGALAAEALQDLRGIESGKHFYHLQNQPHQQQQQQPSLQSRQHLPVPSESSAGLLHSSPALHPQSPHRLPIPLIRTPPLYNESDLHNNISPTSSSSSPYTSLHNNIPNVSHSHPSTSSLQELGNEQAYSNLLLTCQNGTARQQQQQQQSPCLPERNNTILREHQVSSSSWYSPMHTPSTYPESQPVASNSRLHRMDMLAATTCGAQTGTLNVPCTSSLTELSNQLGISTSAIQGQNQRAYRDAFNEQDQQSQFDLQNQLAFGAGGGSGPMAAPKRCPSPAPSSSTLPRLAKCPPQSEAQGRQPLSGSSSYHPSVGTAEFAMNPSSTVIRAGLEDKRHVIPCPPKPMRTYTKVYKLGSITRALNVNRFRNYEELWCELAHMFNLEGQLEQKHGWKLVFVDNENDLLLVGDDPWEEFKITVRGIRILSPREVCFYMDEERFGTGNAMASNLAA